MSGPHEARPPAPPIAAGRAREAVAQALVDVLSALARLEAVVMAIARGLDSSAEK